MVRIVFVGLVALALAAFLGLRLPVPAQGPGQLKARLGDVLINLEVADTPAERALGLSGRASLAPDQGMMFVFPNAGQWGIWMKDMKFPLDIIWLDEQKEIVHIEENVLPETYPKVFTPLVPAKYVLEVNAGFVKSQGIKINAILSLP